MDITISSQLGAKLHDNILSNVPFSILRIQGEVVRVILMGNSTLARVVSSTMNAANWFISVGVFFFSSSKLKAIYDGIINRDYLIWG